MVVSYNGLVPYRLGSNDSNRHRSGLSFSLWGGDAELKAVSGLGKAEEADCVPKEAGCNLEVADCS